MMNIKQTNKTTTDSYVMELTVGKNYYYEN